MLHASAEVVALQLFVQRDKASAEAQGLEVTMMVL